MILLYGFCLLLLFFYGSIGFIYVVGGAVTGIFEMVMMWVLGFL